MAPDDVHLLGVLSHNQGSTHTNKVTRVRSKARRFVRQKLDCHMMQLVTLRFTQRPS